MFFLGHNCVTNGKDAGVHDAHNDTTNETNADAEPKRAVRPRVSIDAPTASPRSQDESPK